MARRCRRLDGSHRGPSSAPPADPAPAMSAPLIPGIPPFGAGRTFSRTVPHRSATVDRSAGPSRTPRRPGEYLKEEASMKRYTMSALAVTLALLCPIPASASAPIFHVQAITVTRAGSLNIFMATACPPTHDRYQFTVTVRQRGRHHTINEASAGTEQLGVCNPGGVSVFPFLQNGLCGAPRDACLIGSGFNPGRATVTWTGGTFIDAGPPGLPPSEETGSAWIVLRRACARGSSGPGPGALQRRC